MEFDIVPELLEKIKADYEKNISAINSEDVLNQLIKSNNLDDAYAYARKIGQALSDALAKNISADLLPNGRMYFNIANRLIPPTLTRAYKDSANISEIIMANINAQNKIGMMVQQGIMNADRITGIVDRLSEAEKFEDVKFLTGRAVMQNVTQSAVDDTIEANAQFQYKSGIRARVERKLGGKCCAWCQKLVGKYTYPNVPEDVYRRHENCRCTVIYYPSKTGKGQDVWSKKKVDNTKASSVYSQRKAIDNLHKSGKINASSGNVESLKKLRNPIEKSRIINEAIAAKRPFYDENLRKAYDLYHIKPKEGFYDVLLHGSSTLLEYEKQYSIDADTLYMIISGRKDYKFNDVRLLSCSTGQLNKNGYCVAQDLANKLGVNVYAPIDKLSLNPNGKLTVGILDLSEEEGFKLFTPGGKK